MKHSTTSLIIEPREDSSGHISKQKTTFISDI